MLNKQLHVQRKMLAGENIGKFGDRPMIRQSSPIQTLLKLSNVKNTYLICQSFPILIHM